MYCCSFNDNKLSNIRIPAAAQSYGLLRVMVAADVADLWQMLPYKNIRRTTLVVSATHSSAMVLLCSGFSHIIVSTRME